ncbi:MAG TPA: T9SS type A sorting domain-containing protein [Candidatus Krumholzibacteria bacterium]|nr:T9SS type A sorting domain-containing protein [Candidatus Krumholzibacteria bacterium]
MNVRICVHTPRPFARRRLPRPAGPFLALTLLALGALPALSQTWTLETVPSAAPIYPRTSIAVDTNHIPHIATGNNYNSRLLYSSRAGGVWTTEDALIYGGVWSNRGLRIDTQGHPRVIMERRLATRDENGWTTASAPGGYNWWEASAIDPDGVSRVTYLWSWGSGLYTGGFVYEYEDLAPNIFLPTTPSCEMEFDANGEPHIVAVLTAGAPIKHWYRENAAWTSEEIGTGLWPSMAFDAQGRLHVCYYAYPSHILMHSMRLGPGHWVTNVVDFAGDTGMSPSVAVDSRGRVNVSYYDVTHHDLKFARWNNDGTPWTTLTVDSVGDVGQGSSLAVDGDVVHISYYDATAEQLRYAQLVGSLTAVAPSRPMPRVSVRALPNPFNPSTTIEYDVPVRAHVLVTVFDVSGRRIATLVDANQSPGTHRVPYRARTASGVYIVSVNTAGGSASIKIVLLK